MEGQIEGRKVRVGEVYRHFKGNLYYIQGTALNTETGEKVVVYRGMYEPYSLYVRSYDMFLSEVDHDKYPDVTQKYRFELVS